MRQLTQNLKNGEMRILEVPFPFLGKGQVLVRNYYSVISAGTEGKSVKDARLGYIGKAKARQKEVKKVIESIKNNGFMSTYKGVMNKLEAPSPLGYSCAGEVIGVGDDVNEFKVGDLVACGGSGAVHAEVISVSKNLCSKIPDSVDVKHAAFTTIASIAIQGIRQANLRLGESCVVIGLGLIGGLSLQLLNASGVQTIGIDIDDRQVHLAKGYGASLAVERGRPDLEQMIFDYSNGYGTDAVIITAGTSSLDPVELAGRLCRKKGKVIIVGAVPTGFGRANYYKKELDLRMSCSYGPGRYDANYEEKGIDYPIGYVRWTENRNMLSFLQLLKDKKLDIEKLITHQFDFERAQEAYKLIVDRNEPFVGIVLKYNIEKQIKKSVKLNDENYIASEVNVGFVGAGSFAQKFLLPVIKKNANMVGVATAHGNTGINIANKYGFQFATCSADEVIDSKNINTTFIATRHNLHAEYVLKALINGKNVFVEKPLAMTLDELEEIKSVYEQSANRVRLIVGFNRRFAPHIQKVKNLFLEDHPKAINYRINAGMVPPDHWIHDKEVGGGRIIGEVCHFVDLAMFLAGARIISVSANIMRTPSHLLDTLVVNLGFGNGSVANISYFSNGNKKVKKEYLEVFCCGQVAIIDDFRKMSIFSNKVSKFKLSKQDKGHSEEVRQFVQTIKEGKPAPISFDDIYLSTLTTFKILESIRDKKTVIFN